MIEDGIKDRRRIQLKRNGKGVKEVALDKSFSVSSKKLERFKF